MKILGLSEDGYFKKYITEVSHEELEKFFDKYYGNLKGLKVGDTIDLGKGYDWAEQVDKALSKTKEFFDSNSKNIETITTLFKHIDLHTKKGK